MAERPKINEPFNELREYLSKLPGQGDSAPAPDP